MKYRYSDDPKVLRHFRVLQDIRSEGFNWKNRPDQDLQNHARVMAYYEVIDRNAATPDTTSTPVESSSKVLMLQKEILELQLKIKELELQIEQKQLADRPQEIVRPQFLAPPVYTQKMMKKYSHQ